MANLCYNLLNKLKQPNPKKGTAMKNANVNLTESELVAIETLLVFADAGNERLTAVRTKIHTVMNDLGFKIPTEKIGTIF
jgi:hypothetical protein